MEKKRRTFTATQKAEIALKAMSNEESMASLCRQYNLSSEQISHWKAELRQNAERAFGAGDRTEEQERRIAELERMVGKLTMHNEILKKTAAWTPSLVRNNGSGL